MTALPSTALADRPDAASYRLPTSTFPATGRWERICPLGWLTPGRGVTALVGGEQVAVVLHPCGELFAVANYDPCSGAYVIARGIVGSHRDTPTIASPLYKQRYDLRTGVCLDEPDTRIGVYDVRVHDGHVEVAA